MPAKKTRAKLVTSYTIKAQPYDTATGQPTGNQYTVGKLSNIDPTERRDVYESYGIGEPIPDEPYELVPGVVRGKALRVSRVCLWVANIMEAFSGRNITDPIETLRKQDEPFVLEEVVVDPNNADNNRVRQYLGCWISEVGSTRNLAGGDIREIETATINYRTVVSADQS